MAMMWELMAEKRPMREDTADRGRQETESIRSLLLKKAWSLGHNGPEMCHQRESEVREREREMSAELDS